MPDRPGERIHTLGLILTSDTSLCLKICILPLLCSSDRCAITSSINISCKDLELSPKHILTIQRSQRRRFSRLLGLFPLGCLLFHFWFFLDPIISLILSFKGWIFLFRNFPNPANQNIPCGSIAHAILLFAWHDQQLAAGACAALLLQTPPSPPPIL